MSIPRKDLVRLLETVEPARSTKIVSPLLTHYWFTDGEVTTYNDQIAISAPTKINLTGAVPGQLLSVLKASNGVKEVELVCETDGSLLLKNGPRSKVVLQMMSLADSEKLFRMPEAKGRAIEFESLGAFLSVLKACMRSVGTDTAVPDQVGVTLVPDGEYLRMFATNDRTLTAGKVRFKGKIDFKRALISSEFCWQLLALCGETSHLDFTITDDYSLAVIDDVTVFGRLRQSSSPVNFERIVSEYAGDRTLDDLVALPKISDIIDRAIIIAGTGAEEVQTEIVVDDGEVKFSTQSKIAEATDRASIDKHHPRSSIRLAVKWLRDGYDHMPENTMIAFAKKGVVMVSAPGKSKVRGDLIYIVSAGT